MVNRNLYAGMIRRAKRDYNHARHTGYVFLCHRKRTDADMLHAVLHPAPSEMTALLEAIMEKNAILPPAPVSSGSA